MEEEIRKKMHEEELNFLKEELQKVDARIKGIQYGGSKGVVEAQIELWELREKIMKETNKFVDIYSTPYNEEDNEIQRLVPQKRNKKVILKYNNKKKGGYKGIFMRKIAILNFKGGTGKTTTAVN